MSTSKIINDFNKCLLKEKFYDYKYNLKNYRKKHNDIKSLFESIKNNNSDNEFQEFQPNDSITTNEALNNPHLEKLSRCLTNVTRNKKYKFYAQKNYSYHKKNYAIKTLNIQEYSNCVKIKEKRNKTKNGLLMPKIDSNNNIKNILDNRNKERPLSTKLNYNLKIKSKTVDYQIINDKHLNIYHNNKFKDSLSSFLYHVNNITGYKLESEKSKEDSIKKDTIQFYNEEISKYFTKKHDNTKEIKMIKRSEVDIANIFLIQKPLIASIRGKILKNLKKKYKKPIRNVLNSIIFYNYKNYK